MLLLLLPASNVKRIEWLKEEKYAAGCRISHEESARAVELSLAAKRATDSETSSGER
jgi:hypothetical protein